MELFLFAAIAFLSFSIQALTGFGSIVLAVTLGGFFYPIEQILPILVCLDFSLNLYLAIRWRGKIDRELLFAKILPWMGGGTLFGIALVAGGIALSKAFFAAVIFFLTCLELFPLFRARLSFPLRYQRWLFFSSGIVQGMYASGGPLLTYALNLQPIDKGVFRSTLAVIWTLFDFILLIFYSAQGFLNLDMVRSALFLHPLLAIPIFFGELFHRKIEQERFKRGVLYLLWVSSLLLLVLSIR